MTVCAAAGLPGPARLGVPRGDQPGRPQRHGGGAGQPPEDRARGGQEGGSTVMYCTVLYCAVQEGEDGGPGRLQRALRQVRHPARLQRGLGQD